MSSVYLTPDNMFSLNCTNGVLRCPINKNLSITMSLDDEGKPMYASITILVDGNTMVTSLVI